MNFWNVVILLLVGGGANGGGRRTVGTIGIIVGVMESTGAAAFCPKYPKSTNIGNKWTSLNSWPDKLISLFGIQDAKTNATDATKKDSSKGVGTIIRLAARKYDTESSRPSSRKYTTRKDAVPSVIVTKGGVTDDYNHYRTIALNSTVDRALSILTTDVMTSLKATYTKFNFNDGDLGENILVDGVNFNFFSVGRRYIITSQGEDDESTKTTTTSQVSIEITEPIEPCANLCKLPYINDETISPSKRIARCQEFLEHLDRHDGYRGWYAKVLEEGIIENGATLSQVTDLK